MNKFKHNGLMILVVGMAMLWLTLPLMAQTIDPTITVLPVFTWGGDEALVDGAEAVLTRMEHGLSVSIETYELVPGEVYTGWWVIFNDRDNCSDADCSLDDIFLMDNDDNFILNDMGRNQLNRRAIETARISQLGAGSAVADEDGHIILRAHLPIGDLTDYVTFGDGLVDPMGAEVHLVLRTHGPVNPKFLWEQRLTDWGGCPDPDDRLPCKNFQFAVFQPTG